MTELLKFPFCGGEPVLNHIEPHTHHLTWEGKPIMPDYPGSWTIECCDVGMIKDSREDVVTAWNRRSIPASTDMEALRKQNVELQSELAFERSHRNQLQKALNFWLPCVPSEPEEISKRVADDAMLLMGYGGHDEQSAEQLGWLSLDATRFYRYLRERNLESVYEGGVFAGLTPDNVVLSGEDLDAAIREAIATQPAAREQEGRDK